MTYEWAILIAVVWSSLLWAVIQSAKLDLAKRKMMLQAKVLEMVMAGDVTPRDAANVTNLFTPPGA